MVNSALKGKKDTKNTIAVKVNLSEELHMALRIKCIQTKQTIQKAIESLISEWVKKE